MIHSDGKKKMLYRQMPDCRPFCQYEHFNVSNFFVAVCGGCDSPACIMGTGEIAGKSTNSGRFRVVHTEGWRSFGQ
jgi:hypothetical protein